jgi:hypothetical protein
MGVLRRNKRIPRENLETKVIYYRFGHPWSLFRIRAYREMVIKKLKRKE